LALNGTVAAQGGQKRGPDTPSNPRRLTTDPCNKVLERLFSFATLPNGGPLIIPSFELVKFKYDPESNPNRDLQDDPNRFVYYILPVLIYIALTALGFRMAFVPHEANLTSFFAAPIDLFTENPASGRPFIGTLTYTFLGAYIGQFST
jgi:hypothetical protein